MASLDDYLRSTPAERNKKAEDFLKSAGTYSANRDVLKALGAEDTQKKPALGLLTGVLKGLAVPGNLIRAGLLEVAGKPTPELAGVSGFEEFKQIATGKIDVGFGDVPGLKLKPGEKGASKVLKLGTALALDIATDPFSYVGAPGIVGRRAAAELLVDQAPKLATSIRAISPKASSALDDFIAKTPPAQVAELQKKLGITAADGTPLNILENPEAYEQVLNNQLGNYLGEGLMKGGRKEVLSRLETLTGDRVAALNLFKSLPDDIRGGLVVTNLLGKPIKGADGKAIRLTSGTGEKLGKAGEVLNTARLAASVGVNPVTRALVKGGDILADTRKALLTGDETVGRSSLIEFTKVRKELAKKSQIRNELHSRAKAALNIAAHNASRFEDPAERQVFESSYKDSFFRPLDAPTPNIAIEAAAQDSAFALRKAMKEIYDEAKRAGLDMGEIGTPDTYTPLILTEKATKALRRTMRSRMSSADFTTTEGRQAYVRWSQDPRVGFASETDPEKRFLDAREVNDLIKEENVARAKRGEALDVREYETDPSIIFAKYAYDLGNRIAARRFSDAIVKSGIVFKDVSQVQRLLQERNVADFLAGLSEVNPALAKQAAQIQERTSRELGELIDVKSLDEVKKVMADIRLKAKQDVDVAVAEERNLSQSLSAADDEVSRLAFRAPELTRTLRQYEGVAATGQADIAAKERIARSLRAKVARAQDNAEYGDQELFDYIDQEIAAAVARGATGDVPLWQEVRQEIVDRTAKGVNDLAILTPNKAVAEAELADARELLKTARSGQVQGQIQQADAYVNAVVRRNELADQLSEARAKRVAARKVYDGAAAEAALDSVNNLDTLVGAVRTNLRALKEAESELTYRINQAKAAGTDSEGIKAIRLQGEPAINALRDRANSSKELLRRATGYTTSRFEGAVKEYSTKLLDAVEKLTDDELIAFELLRSNKNIGDYIEQITATNADMDTVMRVMGDMMVSYRAVADNIDPATFEKLTNAQAKLLKVSNLKQLKEDLYRDKDLPSALADNMAAFGLEEIGVNAATKDLYASSGVRSLMEEIYRVENDLTPFEKIVDDYIDPLLQLWKVGVTVGRGPGYLMTNVMGGMYMNYLANVSLRSVTTGGKALFQISKTLKEVQKRNPGRALSVDLAEAEEINKALLSKAKIGDSNLYEIMNEFFARGGFSDTETQFGIQQVAKAGLNAPALTFEATSTGLRPFRTETGGPVETAYRGALQFLMTNRVQRGLNNMAQSSEMFNRVGAFIDGFEKYGNFDSAMAQVHLLHFNYQDLSDAEQWIRRIVPFYTWTRNNVPAQLRAMIMQPGKLQRVMYANEEFQNYYGAQGDDSWLNQVLPEYVNVSDGFATQFKFGDNNIGFFLKLPSEDINKLFKVNGFPIRLREAANMLGPFTTPIEIAAGVNLSTGAPFNPAGEAVPAYYNLLKYIPGSGVYTDEQGQVRASGAFVRGVQDLFPALGTAEKAVTGATALPALVGAEPIKLPDWAVSERQRERALTDLLNVTGLSALAGGTAVTLTPSTLRGELMRRTDIQAADIKRLAASNNIDVDWVRAQLRAGRTPQDIAMLINAGQGRVSAVPERSALKSETLQRYRESIAGL